MKKTIILLLLAPIVYSDDVYQYKDTNGNLVITNKSTPNAEKMVLPPLKIDDKAMNQRDITKNKVTNLGTNEANRKKVLQEELTHEKLALTDTQKLVQENKDVKIGSDSRSQQAYQERIKILNDAVIEHQKNIEILNKQLGN